MNNTPRNLDDYDPSEWGNVQLPGLSDEELHAKNWNKVSAARHATKVRVELQNQDPVAFKQRQSAYQIEAFKDPVNKLNHQKGVEKRESNPEYKENIKIARKKEAQSNEGRARRSKQIIRWLQSNEGKEFTSKVKPELSAKRAKPLISEFGVFRSVNLLCNFILDNKLFPTVTNKMAIGHKIRKLIKDNPANYFYISIDEYELCLTDSNQIEILKSRPILKKLQNQANKRLKEEKDKAYQTLKKMKNNKPIIVEWGIYPSKRKALEAGLTMNLDGNVEYKISKGLKQFPENYRYITQEEYMMLTGKEI